jgi:pimeloyl-ACP methyl ester carboxylesterase
VEAVLRPRNFLPIAILLLPVVLAGCGGADRPRDPLSDDSSRPLDVRVSEVRTVGTVEAERLDFAAADGQRVPALFARPLSGHEAGCLIYEGGFRSRKENAIKLWQPAAKLGLSTFSLDMRLHGERAERPKQLDEATGDPAAIEALVTGTVVDLRRAIDYLGSLPECRGRIAYAGVSLGGVIGSILAGRDRRVGAAVLMSVSPTFRNSIHTLGGLIPDVKRDPERLERRLSPYDPVKWIPRIAPRPVMLLHGEKDPFIPMELARQTQAAAREPAVKLIYAGGHDPAAPPAGRKNAAAVLRFLRAWLRGDAGTLSQARWLGREAGAQR